MVDREDGKILKSVLFIRRVGLVEFVLQLLVLEIRDKEIIV